MGGGGWRRGESRVNEPASLRDNIDGNYVHYYCTSNNIFHFNSGLAYNLENKQTNRAVSFQGRHVLSFLINLSKILPESQLQKPMTIPTHVFTSQNHSFVILPPTFYLEKFKTYRNFQEKSILNTSGPFI